MKYIWLTKLSAWMHYWISLYKYIAVPAIHREISAKESLEMRPVWPCHGQQCNLFHLLVGPNLKGSHISESVRWNSSYKNETEPTITTILGKWFTFFRAESRGIAHFRECSLKQQLQEWDWAHHHYNTGKVVHQLEGSHISESVRWNSSHKNETEHTITTILGKWFTNSRDRTFQRVFAETAATRMRLSTPSLQYWESGSPTRGIAHFRECSLKQQPQEWDWAHHHYNTGKVVHQLEGSHISESVRWNSSYKNETKHTITTILGKWFTNSRDRTFQRAFAETAATRMRLSTPSLQYWESGSPTRGIAHFRECSLKQQPQEWDWAHHHYNTGKVVHQLEGSHISESVRWNSSYKNETEHTFTTILGKWFTNSRDRTFQRAFAETAATRMRLSTPSLQLWHYVFFRCSVWLCWDNDILLQW